MIFFINVRKTRNGKTLGGKGNWYEVPLLWKNENNNLTTGKMQLVSWNEVYYIDDKNNKIQIENVAI
jgi:hypothetical protein